jgi:hypothetical protein
MDPLMMQNLLTQAVSAALVPFEQRINARFDGIDARFDALDHRINGIDLRLRDLEKNSRRQFALQSNSTKNRSDKLECVPNLAGEFPLIPYPATLNHLLVPGNERIPFGDLNTWSRIKSQALLDFYGAADTDDSESEAENTPTARALRLKLAKVIGINTLQLQSAYSSFAD